MLACIGEGRRVGRLLLLELIQHCMSDGARWSTLPSIVGYSCLTSDILEIPQSSWTVCRRKLVSTADRPFNSLRFGTLC